MSKIEQLTCQGGALRSLVKKLCPDGVEYKPLWEVTIWDKKFNAVDRYKQPSVIKYHYLLANDLKPLIVEGGSVKLLTTSTTDLFTTEERAGESVSEGEVVSIPWGGNPNVQYYKGKFLTADNRIATSFDTSVLDNKYLFYFMQSRREEIGSFYRGSGIKHPDMSKVLDLLIPLPPIEIQREVVEVLDKFALLEAELEAELAKRKKQYEHYRRALLGGGAAEASSPNEELRMKNEELRSDSSSWPRVKLGEVCEFIRGPFGGSLKKDCFKPSGYAVYEQQHAIYSNLNIRYYIDDAKFLSLKRFEVKPGELIVSCSGTIGRVYVIPENAPRGVINQALLKLTPTKRISALYLRYFFEDTITAELNSVSRGGAIKNVPSVAELKRIEIPLPPLAEQERIVAILDRFDALCNSLVGGLPAEIERRKKQYAYYRDKLLAFRRKGEGAAAE